MEPDAGGQLGHRTLVHAPHKLGHDVPVMARYFVLRDGMGGRIGMAVLFHPSDSLDALPHGECGQSGDAKASQAEFEDRLGAVFQDFLQGGESFGVLWITVDQAHDLRKTHGSKACESMLEKVERAMANGLRPAEEMRRWGDDEFLILSHERTPVMLATHAQVLAGLARTADFRWWGDRTSLTVSIGAAQAERERSLIDLLERAKAAMFTSFHAGGNQIASAPREQACSLS
jgi:diguanylate cyclase (GGDEF)-like protein